MRKNILVLFFMMFLFSILAVGQDLDWTYEEISLRSIPSQPVFDLKTNTVYLYMRQENSTTQVLYTLNKNGTLSLFSKNIMYGSISIFNGNLAVANGYPKDMAQIIDLKSKKVVSEFLETDYPDQGGLSFWNTPSLLGNTLLVGTNLGKIHVIDIRTGDLIRFVSPATSWGKRTVLPSDGKNFFVYSTGNSSLEIYDEMFTIVQEIDINLEKISLNFNGNYMLLNGWVGSKQKLHFFEKINGYWKQYHSCDGIKANGSYYYDNLDISPDGEKYYLDGLIHYLDKSIDSINLDHVTWPTGTTYGGTISYYRWGHFTSSSDIVLLGTHWGKNAKFKFSLDTTVSLADGTKNATIITEGKTPYGDRAWFNVIPKPGFRISKLKVNGKTKKYNKTFSLVSKGHSEIKVMTKKSTLKRTLVESGKKYRFLDGTKEKLLPPGVYTLKHKNKNTYHKVVVRVQPLKPIFKTRKLKK